MNENIENKNTEPEVTEHTPDITPEEKAEKKSSGHSFLRGLVDNFETLVFAACAVIMLFTFVARECIVSGSSMYDTLENKDWLIVSNIGYTPERGDIVVFHMTGKDRFNEPLVKRVIATGGEWIDIDFMTWTVRIADNPEMKNAITIQEPYIYMSEEEDYVMTSVHTYPLQVPEGHLFVMGDNRNHSSDSRGTKCGFVDERRVLGKVILRIWPFESIEHKDYRQ